MVDPTMKSRPDEPSPPPVDADQAVKKKKRSVKNILPAFVIFLLFWLVFSGKFDPFHISLGIVSSLIIAYLSADLLFSEFDLARMPGLWLRFARYTPWLIYQVFLANIHVLRLVFHPKMMDLIDPKIIRFKSKLKDDMALVTFANSITLTPGTITVYVSIYGDFEVHIIDIASGEGLPGEMEERVARIFK